MTALPSRLPDSWSSTRDDLHRVAAHVLARRRSTLVGKIGLRATPGGIATPAAGPDHEVLRTSGAWLLREQAGSSTTTRSLHLVGATLAQAAELADLDLTQPLDVGADTPPLGDPDAPLAIEPTAAAGLGDWFAFGWSVIDQVIAELGAAAEPSVVQLWPEHFDAAADVVAGATRVNLGASPGDAGHPEPYLYLGPWSAARPGDGDFWNAGFGAVLDYTAVVGSPDASSAALAFFGRGLELLRAG